MFLKFIPETHQYFIRGKEYTSATTVVDKYIPEFDQEFWSRYKAVERLFVDREDLFKELKKQKSIHSPGWHEWMLKWCGKDEEDLFKAKTEILREWKEENALSLKKGTAYHDEKEREAYEKGYSINPFTNKKYKTIQKKGKYVRNLESLRDGYYPELILWNDQMRICGTADRVFVKGREVWVDDHKTNREIKKRNFFEKMKYPVNRLDNCNYNHYRLQLGIYGWMLREYGYKIKGISINHMGKHYKFRFSSIITDVIKMLEDYRKAGNLYGFSEAHTR